MAEKFGDTSLQELINVESMSGLNAYYEKFLEVLGDDAEICSGPNSGLTLGELMRHLHHNVLGQLLSMALNFFKKHVITQFGYYFFAFRIFLYSQQEQERGHLASSRSSLSRNEWVEIHVV